MSDEEYFEQLCSNSMDGTLTDAEREKLEAHLAECPSCAALKRDLERMQELFAAEEEPPAGLHEGIMQRLEQESRLRVVQPEKPVRRMPVFTMVAAAAVVVLVVLGGGLMPMFSTVNSGGDAAAEASAAEGAADLALAGRSAAQPGAADGAAADAAGAAQQSAGAAAESAVADAQPAAMPENLRVMTVSHCYLAQGAGELPDVNGELLGTEGDTSWFLLENNLSTLQDTLGALEEAGYAVSAYEAAGITIESKAASWLLVVVAG